MFIQLLRVGSMVSICWSCLAQFALPASLFLIWLRLTLSIDRQWGSVDLTNHQALCYGCLTTVYEYSLNDIRYPYLIQFLFLRMLLIQNLCIMVKVDRNSFLKASSACDQHHVLNIECSILSRTIHVRFISDINYFVC